ncbi:MAG: hypothetical protein NVSMB39_1210 [Candidatus Saccharimonadales bacterium]
MYGQGARAIVPAVLGASTVAVLPQTGADTSISIAVAAVAGLLAWGVVYMSALKLGKR